MRKILIFNTFGIGDVLFSTALIASIKSAFPDDAITYIANRRSAEVLKHNPHIDQILEYERDDFLEVYKRNLIDFMKKWINFFMDIRSRQFDVMFDFSLNRNLGFFFWLCGIPKRIGFNYRQRGTFLTDKILFQEYTGKHIIEYDLDLLKNSVSITIKV